MPEELQDRPYRKGLSDETAINELIKLSDTQFDPNVVKAFIEAHNDGKLISCTFKSCAGKKEPAL